MLHPLCCTEATGRAKRALTAAAVAMLRAWGRSCTDQAASNSEAAWYSEGAGARGRQRVVVVPGVVVFVVLVLALVATVAVVAGGALEAGGMVDVVVVLVAPVLVLVWPGEVVVVALGFAPQDASAQVANKVARARVAARLAGRAGCGARISSVRLVAIAPMIAAGGPPTHAPPLGPGGRRRGTPRGPRARHPPGPEGTAPPGARGHGTPGARGRGGGGA